MNQKVFGFDVLDRCNLSFYDEDKDSIALFDYLQCKFLIDKPIHYADSHAGYYVEMEVIEQEIKFNLVQNPHFILLKKCNYIKNEPSDTFTEDTYFHGKLC